MRQIMILIVDDYSDNDEDYGDEGRFYRVMCTVGRE
jgi:hypothetical protein